MKMFPFFYRNVSRINALTLSYRKCLVQFPVNTKSICWSSLLKEKKKKISHTGQRKTILTIKKALLSFIYLLYILINVNFNSKCLATLIVVFMLLLLFLFQLHFYIYIDWREKPFSFFQPFALWTIWLMYFCLKTDSNIFLIEKHTFSFVDRLINKLTNTLAHVWFGVSDVINIEPASFIEEESHHHHHLRQVFHTHSKISSILHLSAQSNTVFAVWPHNVLEAPGSPEVQWLLRKERTTPAS